MAWTNSKVFSAFITDALNATASFDLNADTFKVALFDNTITPDGTVASASSGYNTGVWLVAAEVDDTTEWDAGGEPLTGVSSAHSAGLYTFDATDTPSGGSSATLANVYGGLVHDDTLTTPVADQGVSFNYFGGANSVTNGTFTVVWNASGVFTINAA
jgi:hypothetical protein